MPQSVGFSREFKIPGRAFIAAFWPPDRRNRPDRALPHPFPSGAPFGAAIAFASTAFLTINMLTAFFKAFHQIWDPASRRAVGIGLITALAVLACLWVAVGFFLAGVQLFESWWMDLIADLLGGAATVVLTWCMFPAVVSGVMGLLLDGIAEAVEARHYAHLPPAPGQSLAAVLPVAIRFLAVMVLVNLGLLFFLVFPPVFPFVFYAANGYLLGREYFELVALRRVGGMEALAIRTTHRGRLIVAGTVIAMLLTVPVVNLLAPIVATSVMVHLFEGWRSNDHKAAAT